MPRRSTAARLEYDRLRNKDPRRRASVNARRRQRYNEDPEYRSAYRAYQTAWRHGQPVDPNTRNMRKSRGMVWTPEEEAAFYLATECAVCGRPPTKRGLFADHCHDCRRYRGPLCITCNTDESVLRKWGAVCPEGSPMRVYLDRHTC